MAKIHEATEHKRTQPSQMNLDAGRINAREATYLMGVSVVAALVAALGGILIASMIPVKGTWQLVILIFACVITWFGLAFAFGVKRLGFQSWESYEMRLAEWHEEAIEAYHHAHGEETTRTIRQWDLLDHDFNHVLLASLGTHYQVTHGASTPWSRRQLGAVWLGTRRLGDVRNNEAMRRRLIDMGLVIHAGERQAGQWAATTYDDVIELICKNWSGASYD